MAVRQPLAIDATSTQNGWFVVEHPIKMDDDWGYPHDFGNPHIIRTGSFKGLSNFREPCKSSCLAAVDPRQATGKFGPCWCAAKFAFWVSHMKDSGRLWKIWTCLNIFEIRKDLKRLGVLFLFRTTNSCFSPWQDHNPSVLVGRAVLSVVLLFYVRSFVFLVIDKWRFPKLRE